MNGLMNKIDEIVDIADGRFDFVSKLGLSDKRS